MVGPMCRLVATTLTGGFAGKRLHDDVRPEPLKLCSREAIES